MHMELVRSCRGRGSDERSSLCLSTEPGAVPGCPKTRGAWWGAWHGAGPAQLLSTMQPMLRVLGYSKQLRHSGFSCFICLLCAFLLSSQKLQVARGFGWTCDRALSDIFLCLLLTSRLAAGFPEGPLPSTGAAGKVQGEEGGGKGRAGG